MSVRTLSYKAILAEAARGSDRSTLFWWMVKHHDELANEVASKRVHWDGLCRRFADHGLTDTRGLPASRRNARETWLQVRRFVSDARAKRAAAEASRKPGDIYPSRISKNWRPQIVGAVPQAGVASSAPTLPSRSASMTGAPMPAAMDAPFEFATVDDQGNQLEEGKVFYEGRVRTRQGAEQSEKMRRRMKHEDRFR